MARLTVNKKMRVIRTRYKLEIGPRDSWTDVLRSVSTMPVIAKLVDLELMSKLLESDSYDDGGVILWFEVEQETQTSEATECPPTE